jgi:hypothetical protein
MQKMPLKPFIICLSVKAAVAASKIYSDLSRARRVSLQVAEISNQMDV